MKVKKKTVYRSFSPWHIDSFAQFLDDMSRKGWHFQEWGPGLVFEKGEPRLDRYCVEIFSQADDSSLRPEPQTQEFAEYCEAAGWELCDAKGKMCIFKQLRPDAVPILTDQERLESILAAQASSYHSQLGIASLWPVFMVLQWMFSFEEFIFQSTYVILTGIYLVTQLFILMHFLGDKLLAWKMQRKLDQGEPLCLTNWPAYSIFFTLERFLILFLFLALVHFTRELRLLLPILFVFVGIFFYGYYLNKHRPDQENQKKGEKRFIRILCVAILVSIPVILFLAALFGAPPAQNAPPLTMEDLSSEAYILGDTADGKQTSFFGTHTSWELEYKNVTLSYDLYESEYRWVLDRIWEDSLKDKKNSHKDYCTDVWNAEFAYYNSARCYYVRYKDAILCICTGKELTQEQIGIIRDCLGLR